MAKHTYSTQGTCSVKISFDLTGDTVSDIHFERGCNGNAQGVSSLADGMKATELIKRLEGISCGGRETSCPDQLARALKEALAAKSSAE